MPQLVRDRFAQSVRAIAQRTDVVTKARFAKLTQAARNRSWTMARLTDLTIMRDMRDAVGVAVNEGKSFADFMASIREIMVQRGWRGPSPHHAELVFNMNMGAAFTAGRYDQAREAGVDRWRYLKSTSRVPRPEHKPFYNKVYKLGEGRHPPLDYGCNCEWETVLPGEVEDQRPTKDGPPEPADQRGRRDKFRLRPSEFFRPVTVKLSDWPESMHETIRSLAKTDPRFKVDIK